MPVAQVTIDGVVHFHRRVFAPKEASARGWWNSVRRAFPGLELPPWGLVGSHTQFVAGDEVITFKGVPYEVYILRKVKGS